MTDPFDIPSSERGGVRVFTTDLDPEGNAAITPKNVHKLLGEDLDLDANRIEVFPSKALDGMGLSAYLHEGYGVPMSDLKGTSAALDALTGLVILVASGAFKGKATTLEPNAGLRYVGVFFEPRPDPPVKMTSPDAAEGQLSPTGEAPPPMSRRGSHWALVLLAVLFAAALVLFLVL
ncbi:MAG: hypothetical protein QNJ20_01140 [Paracoccaceae bacterium]|nr:hypothetical protein [Paracoccaceae bacterium]